VALINEVYEAHTDRELWQDGDLMLIDNVRTAHNREAYEGPREVLVGMARPGTGVGVLADGAGGCPVSAVVPPFAVVPGGQVQRALHGREKQIVELVEATYLVHGAGDSVNPPSYFLRFPDRPSARIIALPASLGGQTRVDGLKWISSFPDNVRAGVPRASAVLILNDHDTGYPFACLEASIISASRTAASAAAAADWLSRGRPRPARVGFFGVGLIARYIHAFLAGTGWSFDEIGVHDLSPDSTAGFRGHLEQSGTGARITVHDSAES
jgi:ornithine cyclodeaminase